MTPQINLKYLASIADKNNTFEDLKKKALLYEMEPPVARHDKTLLKVELAGDLNFGGLVKENGMQTLTLDVKCLALEDAFVELQLFIHKQAPTSIMIKRMCSLGTKNQDGLLGAVVKSVLRLLFAIVKFCVMLLILAGIAVLFDRFVISNFVDPYLSRFKNRSKHDKSSKSNEPLGDIIELRTLTGKKQYGTLN